MVNPFAKQMIISFFERLWSRGFDTYMFTEQYRLAAKLAGPITAKATKLARQDLLMRGLGFNTLVKDMEGYRSKGHTVDWLLEMTARDGDIDPKTSSRMAKLCFLAEGSPTLRYIIHQLRD